MSDDIEFGEVEQAAPCCALRPDENRHFAVAAYGQPAERDLPIFVDLDVLAEMEDHAASDMGVELGGVLLGGSFVDAAGRPFVVITDSLRAQHYESTKGSFKFTHDTWSAITRERDQFPPELQMVGWYHTHPGWGVFLSGMDMFICDHFFNKKLDVAYVIDPCRGDRGMFQWTDNREQRVRPTGGFFVTTSRFRAAELEYYVAELSGTMAAPNLVRSPAGTSPAPIVHLHQPKSPEPAWQTMAVAGALALQFLLVALIAWKTLGGSPTPSAGERKIVETLDKLNGSLATLEARRQAQLADERTRARSEFLDEAFRELKGAESGAISRLQSRFDHTAKLADDVSARDAQIRELSSIATDTRTRLHSLEADAEREAKKLNTRIDELLARNTRLDADLKKATNELTALQAPSEVKTKEKSSRDRMLWWWLGGGLVAAAFVGLVGWWLGSREMPPGATSTGDTSPPAETARQTGPDTTAAPMTRHQ